MKSALGTGFLKVMIVVVGVAAALGSATAPAKPAKHVVVPNINVPVGLDPTWTALIDLFGDQGWAIHNLDKGSGIITTDWMDLQEDQQDLYADCGTTTSRVYATQIRFNVRVKPDRFDRETEVTVTTTFRDLRSSSNFIDSVPCESRGIVEKVIHSEVMRRTGQASSGEVPEDGVYWCSQHDGACSLERKACVGVCNKVDQAWCSSYTANQRKGALCGATREQCDSLVAEPNRRRGRTNFGVCIQQRAPLPAASAAKPSSSVGAPPLPAKPAPVPAPTPRGHFCSTSTAAPRAGVCTREKIDCERVRDAALAVVADLDACRLVETAFCFVAGGTERCAPTRDACDERRRATTGATGSCEERK